MNSHWSRALTGQVPLFLDGIIRNEDLVADPIHPNDEGYHLVAERVAKVVSPYLDANRRRGRSRQGGVREM